MSLNQKITYETAGGAEITGVIVKYIKNGTGKHVGYVVLVGGGKTETVTFAHLSAHPYRLHPKQKVLQATGMI